MGREKTGMIQEIASFVDPDSTVEFDPASRVSRHASLKCVSLLSLSLSLSLSLCLSSLSVRWSSLSLSSLVISFSYSLCAFPLSLSRTLTVVLVHSTKTKEAIEPA